MSSQIAASPRQNAKPVPRRLRLALLSWSAIWPLITVLLHLGEPLLAGLPLPLKTLLLTGLLVPLMNFLVMPFLTRRLTAWLGGV